MAEQDPEKAKATIGAMMAPNEKVEVWGRLPEAAEIRNANGNELVASTNSFA